MRFKKFDCTKLTDRVIFTDMNIPDSKGSMIDRIMIEQIKNNGSFVNDLKQRIMQATMPSIVRSILFAFSDDLNSDYFESYIKPILETCRTTFTNAEIALGIFKEIALENIKTYIRQNNVKNVCVITRDQEFGNFEGFLLWLHTFTRNYLHCGYCRHSLLNLLEKKCRNDDVEYSSDKNDADVFIIAQNSMKLKFVRNAENKISIYDFDKPYELVLEIGNDHLLGMHNPSLLFQIVSSLKSFPEISLQIKNNEIVISENLLEITNFDLKVDFEKIISMFDQILNKSDFCYSKRGQNSKKSVFKFKKCKIQVGSDKCLVLNRRLKVSFPVIKYLSEKDALEQLIDLAFMYFKCFSVAPVCCRMQSIAPDAIVYDFEKFTYLHINKNRDNYVEMCKLLFPFISDVDDNCLKRKYLEILPVSLIQRFHGEKLLDFIGTLKKVIVTLSIPIVPLSNGNFRIGTTFNASPEMLAGLSNTDKLKAAVNGLTEFFNNEQCVFRKQEDFEYNSHHYFEFDKFNIVEENKTEEFKFDYEPKCPTQLCASSATKCLSIFKYKKYDIFAIETTTIDEIPSETYEIVKNICQNFTESFQETVHFLEYPFKTETELSRQRLKIDIYSFNPAEDVVAQFNESDNCSLAIIDDKIDTIENMNMVSNEQNLDFYRATADYCYYDEDDLIKFFETFKTIQSNYSANELFFEITVFGALRFNNRIEIRPSTFMKVKNATKLLDLLKEIYCFMKETSRKIVKCNEYKNFHQIESTMSIAQQINPLLHSLQATDFEVPNFYCVPHRLYYSIKQDENIKALRELRNEKHMRIRLSPDGQMILLHCSWFYITDFAASFSEFNDFNEIMEEINSDFDGLYIIKQGFLEIFNYDVFEKAIIEPKFAFGNDIEKDDLEQCFKIFQEHANTVRIVQSQYFLINSEVGVSSENLIKCNKNPKNFFEAAKLFGKFFEQWGNIFPDNWINIVDEKNITKEVNKNEKFKPFTIVDNNEQAYLNLAKTLSDCLRDIPSDQLLSYRWLELLPKQFLMNDSSMVRILDILSYLEREGIKANLSNEGFMFYWVSLSVPRLLQLQDMEKLVEFLNQTQDIRMKTSGLISYPLRHRLPLSQGYLAESDVLQQTVSILLDNIERFEISLQITLDSNKHLMLGNYIWLDVADVKSNEKKLISIVQNFDEAFYVEDKDSMRSISELAEKSKKDKENVIKLAKTLNPTLESFSDDLICNENLRILPTDLWKKCNENSDTYEKMIKVLHMLRNKYKMSLHLQLNGNLEISEKIIVSGVDLLIFYENEQLAQKLHSLLVKVHLMHQQNKLLCEEEVKDRSTKSELIYNTKMSHRKSINAKKMVDKNHIFCRIQPNGTLFLNENLWATSEVVSEEKYQAVEISKDVKEIFLNKKFQYGDPMLSILTSLLTATHKQLFEYCYNMCQFIQEEYPDISIIYLPESDMFKFNDVLSIHPRSFFHLRNVDKVVNVLTDFKIYKEKYDKYKNEENILSKKEFAKRKQEIESEEKEFCKKLWEIQNEERAETDFIREKCLNRIIAIIRKPNIFTRLKSIGNINKMDTNENFDLEDIQIQGEFIFKNGNANGFVEIDKLKGSTKFKYSSENIVEAIEMANELDERFKCMNLSDFQSLVEILKSYKSFISKRRAQKINDMPDHIGNKSMHEQLHWWLEHVQEKQKKNGKYRKYRYGNPLKALHHWFKHPAGCQNLEDWYTKIDTFFSTADFEYELDTQNGQFIGRRYKNDKYFGVYSIAHEDSQKDNFVTTFWYKGKKKEKKEKEKEERFKYTSTKTAGCGKHLIITDIEFGNFSADSECILNNSISVKTIQKKNPNFLSLVKQLVEGSYGNDKNVEKVLLFLNDTVKNDNVKRILGKTNDGKKTFHEREQDYEACFDDFMTKLQKKFTNARNIFLCYADDTIQKTVDVLKKIESQKCKVIPIDEFLIEDKDAVQLKEFLESTLGLSCPP